MLKLNNALYFRLLTYVKPYYRLFILGLLATVVMALTQPAVAALMKPLLDGAFVEKDQFYITWMPVALVAIFVVRGIATYVSNMSFVWVSSRVVYDLRIDMFNRIIRLPTRFYDNNPSGKVIAKVIYDVNQVTASATDVLIILVRDTVQVIGLVAWLIYLDWKLSLFIFGMIPVTAAIVYFAGKYLRHNSHELQKSIGDLTQVLGESVRGHKEVKIYGGQSYERGRFSEIANWARRYQVKFKSVASISVPIVEVYGALILALVIYQATHRVGDESISVGTFMSFFIALGLLFDPIKRLTKVNEPLQQGLAAAESVFELVDQAAENETGDQQREPSTSMGRIEFQQVSFQYQNTDKPAIKDLSLSIQPNQTIALVGASGSGKSTLASLLPRLYELEKGRILIDGQDIKTFSLASLRQQIALVSQDVTLFNTSVAANIAYGSEMAIDQERLQAAATAANAADFINDLPDAYDTEIGDNGVRLSGGQRQRLVIARALYKDSPILMLDEATSALDNASEKRVQEAIENLKQNRTTIVIAHRLSTIENADVIVVMQQGEIVEQGTHATLLQQNGHYARLYRTASQQATDL